MRRGAIAVLVGLLGLGSALSAQAQADACEPLLPRALADALAKAFPGYRAPLMFDNAPQDVERDRARGGSGCLGVATGDFTGEGLKDYVIGMTANRGGGAIAVLALPRPGGWNLQRLRSGAEERRSAQFVAVVPPGTYRRSAQAPPARADDERERLECAHDGVRIGTIDGGSFVYCRQQGRWLRVRDSQ